MNDTNTPVAGAGEATPADESFEAFEQRFFAGSKAAAAETPSSDVTGSVDEPADTTAAASETDESQEQEDDAQKDDGGAEPKKKGGYQRKIDKLTARLKELETRLAGEKPAVDAAETSTSELPQSSYQAPKPKLEDFESLETFTEALSDWKFAERDFNRKQSEAQAKQKAEATQILDRWKQRQAEARKAHADHDRVLEAVDAIQLAPGHQRILLNSEHGAELAYQMAKNPEALKTFVGLDVLQAATYFGRLEAQFCSDNSAQETTTATTRAPKPASTVGSRGALSRNPLDEHLASDYEAWESARNAQLLRSRGRSR